MGACTRAHTHKRTHLYPKLEQLVALKGEPVSLMQGRGGEGDKEKDIARKVKENWGSEGLSERRRGRERKGEEGGEGMRDLER